MEIIGEVLTIINDTNILIRSSEDLKSDDELTVVGEIILDDEQKNKLEMEKIVFPKGEIVVLGRQEKEGVYLASLVLTKSERKTVFKHSLWPTLQGLFGPAEEVWRDVPIDPKPKIKNEQNLNLGLNRIISEGDKISLGGLF